MSSATAAPIPFKVKVKIRVVLDASKVFCDVSFIESSGTYKTRIWRQLTLI
jgi:hypothetical protein